MILLLNIIVAIVLAPVIRVFLEWLNGGMK